MRIARDFSRRIDTEDRIDRVSPDFLQFSPRFSLFDSPHEMTAPVETPHGPGDETFTYVGGNAGGAAVIASYDGGAGNDTLDAFFDGETSGAGIFTDFTDHGDGTFTARYYSEHGGGSDTDDEVTISNIENVHIVLRNAYGPGNGYAVGGNDFIRTGDGDDYIETRYGNDTVVGGKGNDTINADGGEELGQIPGTQDVISKDFSDRSVDIVWNIRTGAFSGPGSIINFEAFGFLQTGSGDDTIVTSDFTNASAAPGDEAVSTGGGDDTVTVSNGVDDVDMGAGTDDRLIVDYLNASFPGGIVSILNQNPDGSYSGEHRGTASGGTRTGVTFDGVEHFTLIYPEGGGYGYSDTIITGDGDDIISAGSSSDSIYAGGGEDTVDGGETGSDVDGLAKDFGANSGPIKFDLEGNVFSGPGSYVNLEYFIDLRTGNANDVIVTSTANPDDKRPDDTIYTRGGDDKVVLYRGNDTVHMGAGDDRLIIFYSGVGVTNMTITEDAPGTYSGQLTAGRAEYSVDFSGVEHFTIDVVDSGTNNIVTGDGRDVILSGIWSDTFDTGGGNDVVKGGAGNDTIDGGAGNDKLFGEADHDDIVGGAGNDRLFGGTGNDALDGGFGNDKIFGDAGHDNLVGGDGRDRLFGGTENDALDGGAGDDKIFGDAGDDDMVGGDGDDRLYGGDGIDAMDAGAGDDTMLGDAGNDDMTGGEGDDRMYAGDGNDALSGGDGRDKMFGDGGDDNLIGGADNDRLFGGDGADSLSGGSGRDKMFGDAGDDNLVGGGDEDRLFGGAGDDVLAGDDGDDKLFGDRGDDTIAGGGGADIFILRDASGADTITDFEDGADRIHLYDYREENGGQPLSFDELLITQDGNDTRIELDLDRDGVADAIDLDGDGDGDAWQIELLATDAGTITAADFIF